MNQASMEQFLCNLTAWSPLLTTLYLKRRVNVSVHLTWWEFKSDLHILFRSLSVRSFFFFFLRHWHNWQVSVNMCTGLQVCHRAAAGVVICCFRCSDRQTVRASRNSWTFVWTCTSKPAHTVLAQLWFSSSLSHTKNMHKPQRRSRAKQ